jgi:phosphoglucosamine mutase
MLREKTLVKKTLTTTVMSNLGLDFAIREQGGRVVRTQVGDRYVVEVMKRKGYNFGGEQSGHLIFMEHATTGDGTLAALQILAIMLKQNKPLSELAGSVMERIPQCLLSFSVPKKRDINTLPAAQKAMKAVEKALGEKGRILVRYSGTENKARVLVEGPNTERINQFAEDIKGALISELSR